MGTAAPFGTAKIHELVEVSRVADYICNEGDRWLAPFPENRTRVRDLVLEPWTRHVRN
jgi:hypothetical protein